MGRPSAGVGGGGGGEGAVRPFVKYIVTAPEAPNRKCRHLHPIDPLAQPVNLRDIHNLGFGGAKYSHSHTHIQSHTACSSE